MICFKIRIYKKSTHHVSVVLHNTRQGMRRTLKKSKHKTWNRCDACCWQSGRFSGDGPFAEIHINREFLTVDDISHECCHAAWHRACICGLISGSEDFQEWVATDTGILTKALCSELQKRRIRFT